MPTYEYACKDCGHQFEVVQSFSDDALTVCPSCDGALRKVFSAAGIIFKGSGWHIKDYSASSAGAASNGGSGGDGEPGGGPSDRGSSDSSSAPATAASGSDAKPSATPSSSSSSTAGSGSD
jgi:putative FmdB family regulatory protein